MKQKIKIIFAVSIISAGVCGYLFVAQTGKNQAYSTPKAAQLEPSRTHKPVAAAPAKSDSSSHAAHSAAAATLAPATSVRAPKQQEIQNTIATEYTYHIFATPNDPLFSGSWPLQKVNAPAAWDTVTGNDQTVVAVIDGGFALAHQDLSSQWFTNQGETGMTQSGGRCWTGTAVSKQSNGCDDDNNGYVDDWRGWNFALQDNNPQTGRQNPTGNGVSHGTQVAGLVGAAGNNNIGSTAINWRTKIMPLQALTDNGLGYSSDVVAAMYYAVDNGAQVINISLGTFGNDPALSAAVNYATAHDVVIVAAVGNCGDGNADACQGAPAGTIAYPAQYAEVIAVGATTQSDQRASFSSYGPSIDVTAPGSGDNISPSWSAGNPTSLYASSLYGTSFSTPQVASLASLIKSIRPSTTVRDVTALISATTTKPSSMSGMLYTQALGHGIINVARSILITQNLNTTGVSTPALFQAGGYQAERVISGGSTIGSGCDTTVNAACTIVLKNTATGHERFLPYLVADSSGSAGWSWYASMIDNGVWELQSLHGNVKSEHSYTILKTDS